MNKPRIIVEVHGGIVQVVYADCDEEASSAYEDLICESSLLQKVW